MTAEVDNYITASPDEVAQLMRTWSQERAAKIESRPMTDDPVTTGDPSRQRPSEELAARHARARTRATQVHYEQPDRTAEGRDRLAQLPAETSALLLQAVGDEEAVLLATEIANLPPLDREVVGRVLREFVEKVNATALDRPGRPRPGTADASPRLSVRSRRRR